MVETPFQVHLYSEPWVCRYIEYFKKENYSYVHIGPTGGIVKTSSEQELSPLYAVIFKDDKNPNDTFILGHCIVSNHTVASIAYIFLEEWMRVSHK